jgi:glycosyltransferase involved in cell wall biosynthesis
MKEKPLFSILIANYNNCEFLSQCIESVKKQTYTNWEIVIVDDYSLDDSIPCNKKLLEDERIRIYYNDRNYKTAYSFKRCLDLSNGEICGFLGSDDALDIKAIELTVNKHLELPSYSIVYTLNYICDNNLKIQSITKWGGKMPEGESQLTVPAGLKITSFATFKKSFYNKTEGINDKYTRGFDQDFFYKMEEVGKVYCIEKPLYYYRIHNNNISLNENNIKAWYWLYIANKDAYHRRKNKKIDIKNTSYGELQRTYLKVCLLKIDQKIRYNNFDNIIYYYYQIFLRFLWDKNFLIIKAHIFFFKRFLLGIIKKHEGSSLQYN